MNTKIPQPVPLGLKKSFGYGDRLGLATPGHLAAHNKFDFAPIFAQQSIREMERTQRTPQEVMTAAQQSLAKAGFSKPWGADADHLKEPEHVDRTAAVGFCFFTIDPSAFVVNDADTMNQSALEQAVKKLVTDKVFESADWEKLYLNRTFDVGSLKFTFTQEQLWRAAVKYARAIAHSEKMGKHIAKVHGSKPYEIEVSVDETDSATSPLEHLFFGLELKRRGVKNVVSLAPRFVGDFEKGIDYKGDVKLFETKLKEHVAIAKHCGPYKISVHSGSDKFTAYPIVGRVCGDLLHVKTAGTSYLEALRVVARENTGLFAEITQYCRGRFETDRKSYHISTTQKQVESLPPYSGTKDEAAYLDEIPGRQLLHVTFGSVLTIGADAKGRKFKDGILEVLRTNESMHVEFLDRHFTKHLSLLSKG
jgi:hypothetical protein